MATATNLQREIGNLTYSLIIEHEIARNGWNLGIYFKNPAD